MSKILCGDALEKLRLLPSDSVQLCVTSPPYYGLRDYGVNGQMGNEESPAEYIENLTAVFNEVKRVLAPDGTLWLNIADSYAGSSKGAWKRPLSERPNHKQLYCCVPEDASLKMPKLWDGIKAKDMIGVPWMLAFALRENGWYLRSDIIWQKSNCLPEPVKDRPTKSYEHLFLLSKSPQYYYNGGAIAEPLAESTVERNKRAVSTRGKYAHGLPDGKNQAIFKPRTHTNSDNMRNKRDVWSISTNFYRSRGHFAIFPEQLVEPCILAGCPNGGVVLDPFFGSGTTGAVAKRLGREYIGIDLNPDFCAMAQKRIDNINEGGIHIGG